jgi:ADP-ribose pyrophosphatase
MNDGWPLPLKDKKLMKWQIKHSKYLVDDQWLKLRVDQCQLPNGKIIEPYYVLEYPDWINVFGITIHNEVVLVQQYRHGIGREVVELPSGAVEAFDENPMEAAKRELLEETGYTSDHFIQTAVVSSNPANNSNLTYCFLANDLERVSDPKIDETEEVLTVLVSLEETVELLQNGEFLQALHVTSIFYALQELKILGRFSS